LLWFCCCCCCCCCCIILTHLDHLSGHHHEKNIEYSSSSLFAILLCLRPNFFLLCLGNSSGQIGRGDIICGRGIGRKDRELSDLTRCVRQKKQYLKNIFLKFLLRCIIIKSSFVPIRLNYSLYSSFQFRLRAERLYGFF
jgi:hypothetical protein